MGVANFCVAALVALVGGRYPLALSETGFSATIGLLLAGAQERRGILGTLFWAGWGFSALMAVLAAVNALSA